MDSRSKYYGWSVIALTAHHSQQLMSRFLGYHLNEKSTRETVNEDGWMMTGDICSRSADGYFTVQERLKELIKYSGFQVAPAELEALLLECPMVADAAVIGVWYEDRATELPRAYGELFLFSLLSPPSLFLSSS